MKIYNPYNNEEVGTLNICTTAQIEEKIEKTSRYDGSKFGKELRKKLLNKVANHVKKNQKKIAYLISSESGLSLKDTMHEAKRVEDVFRCAALAVDIIEEDVSHKFRIRTETKSEFKLNVVSNPVRAILAITPFNHPMNQVAHKIAPAIASNAPVLLKPSDKTPLSALKLVEILYECGLPEGMVNVVISNDPKFFLKTSLESNVFDVVTFTGGVDVGRYISRKIAETENNFIKFIPELGGNPAITILEDADIKVAVRSALNAFENSGQRCTSVKRILLHNDIADRFIDSFLKEVKRIYYGNPLDYETDMGTLIDENSALIIEKKVNNAIRDGAKLLFGNQRRGALYSPTVLDYVSIESELVITETFGPVAPIIRINSIDEAIDIINSVPYKLAGSAITKDVNKAKFISDSIQVGQFNWNNNPGFRTEMAPFGGFGVSGNGEKEGVILAAEGFRKVRTFYEHIT